MRLPRLICGASYVPTDVAAVAPPGDREDADNSSNLQSMSVYEAVTAESQCCSCAGDRDSLQSGVSDSTVTGHVLSSISVASGLMTSVNMIPTIVSSVPPSTSLSCTVNGSYTSVISASVSSHCSVVMAPCIHSSSSDGSISTDSKSSSPRHGLICLSLPVNMTCSPCSSSKSIISPASLVPLTGEAAEKSQLSVASEFRCYRSPVSHPLVLPQSSVAQTSFVPVRTLAASETLTSASLASELYSSPSALVSDVVTCSRNQSSRGPPPSQLPDRNFDSQTVLSSSSTEVSFHNFPLLSAANQSPHFLLPGTGNAVALRHPTVTSHQFCACTIRSAAIPNQICSCTSDAPGISHRACIRTDKVHMCGQRGVGISNQLCTCTVSEGISDKVRICAIPSVGISHQVCSCNTQAVLTTSNMVGSGNVGCHGDTTSTLVESRKVTNAPIFARLKCVLSPATGFSTRQTYLSSSASVPSPRPICSPGFSTLQIKSPATVASTKSLTHSSNAAGMSAPSRNDRHFLDGILSLKPHPHFSTMTQPDQILSSSFSRSAPTGKLQLSSNRSPVMEGYHVETGSVPLSGVLDTPVLSTVLRPPALDTGFMSSVKSRASRGRAIVARPTFVLSPPQRPLLEKIAHQTSAEYSSSKSTTQMPAKQMPAKISNIRDSAGDFSCSQIAAGADTESVAMVTSSPENRHRQGNGINRFHTGRDASMLAADKDPASVAMDTAFPLMDRGIRHRSNGEMLSLTDSTVTYVAKASAVDSSCRSNSKLSSVTTETTNSVAVESVVVATTTVNHRIGENIHKRVRGRSHRSGDLSSHTDVTDVATESVVMVTASQADRHRHSNNREMFSVAGPMMNIGVAKKSGKMNLCTKVNCTVFQKLLSFVTVNQFFYATAFRKEADAYMFCRCFSFFFPSTKTMRHLFSGTAEWIFMKLLPNDTRENVV